MRTRNLAAILTVLAVTGASLQQADAQVSITNGSFTVGIGATGELYNPHTNEAFRRHSDNYDPIQPGTPKDSWGVRGGASEGHGDAMFFGSNVIGPSPTGGVTAHANHTTFDGALSVDQVYSFLAANVLGIRTSITNNTGGALPVMFQRNVDWDIVPTTFGEIINVDPLGGQVVGSSYYGFEDPDPGVAYAFSGGAAGGTFGPGDLGGGMQIDLGMIGAGATSFFDVFYGISLEEQTPFELRSQLQGLGASFVITGHSSDGSFTSASHSAAMGFGLARQDVPEPGSLAMIGGVIVSGLGIYIRRRRSA
jgi:hypothetical protein